MEEKRIKELLKARFKLIVGVMVECEDYFANGYISNGLITHEKPFDLFESNEQFAYLLENDLLTCGTYVNGLEDLMGLKFNLLIRLISDKRLQ